MVLASVIIQGQQCSTPPAQLHSTAPSTTAWSDWVDKWSDLASFPGHSAPLPPTPINHRRPGAWLSLIRQVAGTIRQMSALIRQVVIGYNHNQAGVRRDSHTMHPCTHTHTHSPCLLRMRAEEQFCPALDVGKVNGIEWTGERGV